MSDQNLQPPTSNIQRRSKIQVPSFCRAAWCLETGAWCFSGCWMLDVGGFSFSSLKPVSLLPVMLFNIVCHFRQGIFDCLNEVPTTRGHAAQAYDRFALSHIIGHRQNFSVRSES